jgi:hypothetical protein
LTTPAAAFDATPQVVAAVEAYNHGDLARAFRLSSACQPREGDRRIQKVLGVMVPCRHQPS